MCKRYHKDHGINPMWIINNSNEVHTAIAKLNRRKACKHIRTYDFSTLYTSIPHKLLKRQLAWVIRSAFKSSNKEYISVYSTTARWTSNPREDTTHMDCNKMIRVMNWLIDNIFVKFGDKVFRQVIGIPMGTDCAPFLANLFLYSYEYQWINKQRIKNNQKAIQRFKSCSRYIDDLLLINNYDLMKEVMTKIYPKELVLVPDDNNGCTAPFLDLQLLITEGVISTSIYDKRDAFDFPIVNFPNLSGNIPNKSAYGTFICELVRYARGCTFLSDCASRTLLLVKKPNDQRFTTKRLQQTYRKFCTSHLILIHKEWKDQISNDHTLSDHTDNVVPNDVKSVKWSDELGGSLTDIRTFTISPTEIHQKRLNARTIRKQRKQHDQVGPETVFLNPLF